MEQCQSGSVIPKVLLLVPAVILQACVSSTSEELKRLLDEHNPTEVDTLLESLSLSAIIDNTNESNQLIINEINSTAKQWSTDILHIAQLTNSPFPTSIEGEITFWRDLGKQLKEAKEQVYLLTRLTLLTVILFLTLIVSS
jgi:hypothetical protein